MYIDMYIDIDDIDMNINHKAAVDPQFAGSICRAAYSEKQSHVGHEMM